IEAIRRDKGGHWRTSTIINSAGALITGVVGVVIVLTKFTHGAWVVVILIPVIVWLFRAINGHYRTVASQLALDGATPLLRMKHRVIIPISGIHRGVLPALQYASSFGDSAVVTGVYVDTNPETTADVRREWDRWGMEIPLEIIESPYRSIVNTLIR